MKLSMLIPAIVVSSCPSFIASGVLFQCGVPAGLALLVGFGICTLIGWRLMSRPGMQ